MAVTIMELERGIVEVRDYIDGLLREYVNRTWDVDEPPLWDLAPVWPPTYYPRVKKILIPQNVAILWVKAKETTMNALSWGLGHEYWHYVQDLRGERGGIPILSFPILAEFLATKHAGRLSGITSAEGVRLWVELIELDFTGVKPFVFC